MGIFVYLPKDKKCLIYLFYVTSCVVLYNVYFNNYTFSTNRSPVTPLKCYVVYCFMHFLYHESDFALAQNRIE